MTTATSTARDARDRYESLRRLALVQIHPPRNPNRPLSSFFIADILGGTTGKRSREDDEAPRQGPAAHVGLGLSFVRPWACSPPPRSEESTSEADEEEIDVEEDDPPRPLVSKKGPSPLDALLQMTHKTFEGVDTHAQNADDAARRDQLSLFSKTQPPKKRRKSRTAFTNQQIYELEKRFLYQKYLTPADRDEIALSLGLSNAQVITWFQNRRAKLKRDLEELKADVTAAKTIDPTEARLVLEANEDFLKIERQKGLKRDADGMIRASNNKSGHSSPELSSQPTLNVDSPSMDAKSISMTSPSASVTSSASMTSPARMSTSPSPPPRAVSPAITSGALTPPTRESVNTSS